MSAAFAIRAFISSFGVLRSLRPYPMLSATDMCGYSAYDWKTIAMSRPCGSTSLTRRPPMRSSPVEMSSRPATMRRAVDLPQPDGPTRTTNSPSATSMDRSFTAWNPFS